MRLAKKNQVLGRAFGVVNSAKPLLGFQASFPQVRTGWYSLHLSDEDTSSSMIHT
jgi:hypothetical protein